MTYWCEYYILQQIIAKGLQDEISSYAVQLMDKLENAKAENAENDAIVDDVAAKAYIENFALQTFGRADETQRTNKVTKQTADTFMAAATFMDLLSIWGEVDREIAAKSKFAKYHATRILKAFKAGEDPNATNPVVEEPAVDVAPGEDEFDDELNAMEARKSIPGNSASYRPPTVETVEPNGTLADLQSMGVGDSGVANVTDSPTQAQESVDQYVSPMESFGSAASRQESVGGGYFPATPSVPPEINMTDDLRTPQQSTDPQDFYSTMVPPPAAPPAPSDEVLDISSPARLAAPTSNQMSTQPPTAPSVKSPPPPQIPVPQPRIAQVPAPVPVQQGMPAGGYKTDDESTMLAQKHARWAISALNFEDVNTAVKELRLALQSLGAG